MQGNLARRCTPLGPYSRSIYDFTMVLGEGGRLPMSEVPVYSRNPCVARLRGQKLSADLHILVHPVLSQQGHQRLVPAHLSKAQRRVPASVLHLLVRPRRNQRPHQRLATP